MLPGIGFCLEYKRNKQLVPVSSSVSDLKYIAAAVSQLIAGKEPSGFAPTIITKAQGLFDIWLGIGDHHEEDNPLREVSARDSSPLSLYLLCEGVHGLRNLDLKPEVQKLKAVIEKYGFQLHANTDMRFSPHVFRLEVLVTPFVSSQEQDVIAEGKGFSVAVSEIGALAEAIERIVAINPVYSRVLSGNSVKEMVGQGYLIPRIEPGNRDLYSDDLCIDWVSAYMYPNHQAWMPAEKVWHIHPPLSGIYAFDMRTTIGLAAGSSVTEAFANGLLESIERDAYAVVMRCKLECPSVTQDEINACGSDVATLLKELDNKGIDVHIKWVSLDWPIPIAHVLLLDRENRIPAHSHGCSAAISPPVAITRALLESVQVHEGLAKTAAKYWEQIVKRNEGNHSQPRIAWSDPLFRPNLMHLINLPSSNMSSKAKDLIFQKNVKNISELCEWLTEHGHKIFWSHLGCLGGLDVVRVYVEGMVMPDSRLENQGARLKRWVEKLGIPCPYTDPILT